MCGAIIQIPLDQFFVVRASTSPVPHLESKASSFREKYTCFHPPVASSSSGPGTSHAHMRKGGRFIQHHHNTHSSSSSVAPSATRRHEANRTDVVKIGSRELSRENLAKKDFLALMNKLTQQNKAQIYQSINHVFREDCIPIYVQILWDSMQRAPDFIGLYMGAQDVLIQSSKSRDVWDKQWAILWNTFLETKGWAPKEQLLLEEDYDEFCDFVKWKKRTLGALRAWMALSKSPSVPQAAPKVLVQQILQDCNSELDKNNKGSKLTDTFLEEIRCFFREGTEPEIRDIIASWVEERKQSHSCGFAQLRPSTRFKMLDVQDACTANMKDCATQR